MGGFVIRVNVDRLAKHVNDIATQTTNPEQGAEIQGQDPFQSSFEEGSAKPDMENALVKPAAATERVRKSSKSTQHYYNPFHINGPRIIKLRSSGLMPRLPYINTEEITDKSKSDSMVPLIAVVQIVWTVVQIITRATRHLAISQLEIAVVAFAACAIITYALNWSKPKSVQVPFTLLQYRNEIPD